MDFSSDLKSDFSQPYGFTPFFSGESEKKKRQAKIIKVPKIPKIKNVFCQPKFSKQIARAWIDNAGPTLHATIIDPVPMPVPLLNQPTTAGTIGTKYIDYICDTTKQKINKFSPGTHIPIKSMSYFYKNLPNVTYLFAWNHKDEIFKKERKIRKKMKWISHVSI